MTEVNAIGVQVFDVLQEAMFGIYMRPLAGLFAEEHRGIKVVAGKDGRVGAWVGGGKPFADALAEAYYLVFDNVSQGNGTMEQWMTAFSEAVHTLAEGQAEGYQSPRQVALAKAVGQALDALARSGMPPISFLSENPDLVNAYFTDPQLPAKPQLR
ncbi:MAG: hypothetical protein J0L97_07595 [Alphaproteobacteria bacterium]|nr:hypothetical protein [Alphaproteobacteria bacterium]